MARWNRRRTARQGICAAWSRPACRRLTEEAGKARRFWGGAAWSDLEVRDVAIVRSRIVAIVVRASSLRGFRAGDSPVLKEPLAGWAQPGSVGAKKTAGGVHRRL